MNNDFLLNFIELLAFALQALIFIRIILSWVRPFGTSQPERWLKEVTDPILVPFQKILPPMAGLDFSPILALLAIEFLNRAAHNLL